MAFRKTSRSRRSADKYTRPRIEILEDRTLLATFTVTHTGFTGSGSLFWAIEQSNLNLGLDTINFNIPGGGVKTITPEFQFPPITSPVVIDGTTQADWKPDHPVIVLDGIEMAEGNGLEFQVGGNTVKGLVIQSFPWDGIVFAERADTTPTGHNIVQGNFIGTDATGKEAWGNAFAGLKFVNSPHNTVGGTAAGEGNLISGNGGHGGISIDNFLSEKNLVIGNRIGTDISGMNPLGNVHGIILSHISSHVGGSGYGQDNMIGSPSTGEGNVLERGGNIIAGNLYQGIYILKGSLNKVWNNYIGVGLDGVKPIPNGENGIVIEDADNNLIGGVDEGTGNLISGNKFNGILIQAHSMGASSNTVQGNQIGTNKDGGFGQGLGNGYNGIEIFNDSSDESVIASKNLIGGSDLTDVVLDGVVNARNIISGNLENGILIAGRRVAFNIIEGNYIGTNQQGTDFVRNKESGIMLQGFADDVLGPFGTQIGSSQPGAGNVISGNGENGISILDKAMQTFVFGNRIGTTADGLSALSNGADESILYSGVYIEDSSDNFIGGTEAGEGNVISGNFGEGVGIVGDAHNIRVQRNLIGVGADGVKKLPNGAGVTVRSLGEGVPSNNWIGGTRVVGEEKISLGNVISASRFNGVQLLGGIETQVVGNQIGAILSGQSGLGNGGDGISIFESPRNTIGGATDVERNLIVGNTGAGVRIEGFDAEMNKVLGNRISHNQSGGVSIHDGPDSTTIDANEIWANGEAGVFIELGFSTKLTNNYIGTDANGSEPLPNQGPGIWIESSLDTVIGGANFDSGGNLISGNRDAGILVEGLAKQRLVITGNFIGTNIDADKPLGNEYGIVIQASDDSDATHSKNVVRGNVIAGNRNHGVSITLGSFDNQIEGNFIGTNSTDDEGLGNGGSGVFIDNAPVNTIGGHVVNTGNRVASNSGGGVWIQGPESAGNMVGYNALVKNGGPGVIITDFAGATTIQSNEISGNEVAGVNIDGGGPSNTLIGNLIGTDGAGAPRPNIGIGIRIFDSAGVTIGGEGEGEANVISGNTGAGIALGGLRTIGTRIIRNFIGTDINGIKRLSNERGVWITAAVEGEAASKSVIQGNVIAANSRWGILINGGASNNTIGGALAEHGNRISDNGETGVTLAKGTGNTILRNRIFANEGLEIDLIGDDVTPNDGLKDLDTGANNLQNFPELALATVGGSRRIVGTLESEPGKIYALQFFATTEPDPSGYGGAERFVTATAVTTNASGIAFFDVSLPTSEVAGTFLTATATDPDGNTSEFAQSIRIETDTDGDGIPDKLEKEGANRGDGNQDGIVDSQQAQVVSVPSALHDTNVTVELGSRFNGIPAPAGAQFSNFRTLTNPSPDDAPAEAGFNVGFFDFKVTGLTPSQSLVIELLLPAGSSPRSYYRYGPTADQASPHWYQWLFDGETGAEFNGNRVTLHFVDGALGDDDLTANGTIVDAGAPAFELPLTVMNTLDSGPGSLRQAIVDANGRPGLDFIDFNIGTGVQTITPLSNLPAITDPVIIDGTSQPGFFGSPVIELSGRLVPFGTGLTLGVFAQHTTIRGLVINRFANRGIDVPGLFTFGSGVVIEGNFIGTDVTGMLPRGNGQGIVLGSGEALRIGGTTPEARNVISGNLMDGISVPTGLGHLIQGNLIGVAADGTSPLGNGGHGIYLGDAGRITIGGLDQGAGNVVAFNQLSGIRDLGTNQNRRIAIFSNSIYSNGHLGISRDRDFSNVVTLNDSGTLDGFLQNVQNFPVLFSAQSSGGQTVISGYLNSKPTTSFLLQFFSNSAVELSGFGEGQEFLGSAIMDTDATGHVDFTVTLPVAVADRRLITATATASLFGTFLNDTSEFSARLAVGDVLSHLITVNSTNDADDGIADATHTSLREAIHAANNHPGLDVIRFNIGGGVQTIAPLTPMPAITDAVVIDGTTQPGFADSPIIELNGSLVSLAWSGLRVHAAKTTIRGLVINRFTGVGIEVSSIGSSVGFGDVVIEGNFIGTDVTGKFARGNRIGVAIVNGSNHRIGGTTPAAQNVISANIFDGVNLSGGDGHQVQGNLIGVGADGTSPLGNGSNGVNLPLLVSGSKATRVTVGGLQEGAGNVIAFNALNGIQNRQSGYDHAFLSNSIYANAFMGISFNVVNWVVLNEHPNAFDQVEKPQHYPVLWSAQSSGGQTTISGYFDSSPNSSFLLQFFSNAAVELSGFGEGETFLGSASVITDAGGHVDFTATLPVAVDHRHLITATATDSANNTSQFSRRLAVGDVLGSIYTVNSTDDVDDGIADATHTSLREAIHATNNHPGSDVIRFAIGTGTRTIAPLTPLPGITDAVVVDGTTQPGFAGKPIIELSGTLLERNQFSPSSTSFFMTGLAIMTDNSTIRGLVINRFLELGVNPFHDVGPLIVKGNDNVIEGNYIGTNVAGTGALPNIWGPRIFGSGNRIGGTTPQARNVLSGNREFGLELFIGASNNLIQGNFIGTNAAGTAALGNGRGNIFDTRGVWLRGGGQGNVFGGAEPGAGNLISGNNGEGLLIQASGTIVQGNFIGTDATGKLRLGNTDHGIFIESDGVTVGGTLPGERNVISANLNGITSVASDTVIQGNFIGTDVTGTVDLGNNTDGIAAIVRSTGNLIGGTTPGAGNLISGNNRFGILIAGSASNSSGNRIEGNRIGTRADGISPLGNSSDGIAVAADANANSNGTGPNNNFIGGLESAAGNTIAFNGRHGINVLAGTRLAVLANSIFSNAQLGIDLNGDGATANDDGDADIGDNELQNFPVLTTAVSDGVRTSVSGTLNSTPNSGFRLQFFTSTAADPSGFGEGQTLLGSRLVYTDANGNASFTLIFHIPVPAGQFVTATATDPVNNTSEFSRFVQVPTGEIPTNHPPTASAGGPYVHDEGTALVLSALTSVDPDDDPLSFSWDVNGDGNFGDATGVTPTLLWAQLQTFGIVNGPSTFFARVRLDDSQGHEVTSEPTSLTIRNVSPAPNAGPNQVIVEGDRVTFSGSFTDPGTADTHTTRWHVLASNGQSIADSSGPTFEFVTLDDGAYEVTFSVTDSDGDTGSHTAIIFAVNSAPISPILGLPAQGVVGVPIHLTTSAYDPSPIDTAEGFTYEWFVYLNDDLVEEGGDPDLSFTPGSPGEYLIALYVTDKDFGTSTVYEAVTVVADTDGIAPKVTLGAEAFLDEGSVYLATGSFSDPDPGDEWTAIVDYGDGSGAQPLALRSDKTFDLSHVFIDNGIYTVTVRVSDNHGDVGSSTVAVNVNNVRPAPDAGPDQAVNEGESVTLNGSFTDPGTADTHTFRWQVAASNGQAIETGNEPTFRFVPEDNGSYTVTLTVTDDDGDAGTASVVVNVNNLPPRITSLGNSALGGGCTGEGVSVSVAAEFIDLGIRDSHTAIIDWGDGTSSNGLVTEASGAGSGSVSASHVYEGGGSYRISLTLADDESSAISQTTDAVIVASGLHNGVLRVVGTAGKDDVTINLQGNGLYKVHANFFSGKSFREFSADGVQRIVVLLCGGDDRASLAGSIQVPALVDGGDGRDNLKGGGGHDVLLGGDGDDVLDGGGNQGRDLLIGGRGADRLVGNAGDDILIAGMTEFDNHVAALDAIMAEWTSARNYTARVANLHGMGSGPCLNGNYFLSAAPSGRTVFDDGAADALTGSAGQDWFFANLNGGVLDVILDLRSKDEWADDLA